MLEQYISFPIIWCQQSKPSPRSAPTLASVDLRALPGCRSTQARPTWSGSQRGQTKPGSRIMSLIVFAFYWNNSCWWTICIFCVGKNVAKYLHVKRKIRNIMYDHKRIIMITLSIRMRQMTTGARKMTKKRTRM